MYTFFFSYASNDRKTEEDLVKKFYDALCEELRLISANKIYGFLDSEIQNGDKWPENISENLKNCDIFIPLLSPFYFESKYCGKEWTIIDDRINKDTENIHANVIFPVLWN